jgi:hypothetical protein
VLNSSSGIKYEITDLLYSSIEFIYDWESHPADGKKKEDSTLMLGLGVEF